MSPTPTSHGPGSGPPARQGTDADRAEDEPADDEPTRVGEVVCPINRGGYR